LNAQKMKKKAKEKAATGGTVAAGGYRGGTGNGGTENVH
jgi:hypothetical protein